jgi:tripartite-type tricarboxylate transporter receptor subunit TctC
MTKLLIAIALAAAGALGSAQAQSYPNRPITLVVPFAAGGPTDTIARIMAERLRQSLGQTVVVENTTGAAGTIGVGRVARAAPDGYTVAIGHWSTHVVNAAIYPLQYDVLNDFEPISLIADNPQLLVTKNAVPAKDLKELIDWVKANQDKISVGTAGAGAASHVSGVYFQNVIGAKLQFVPYRGAGPALQDVIAGQLDLMFDQTANSLPHVRGGKLKAFAVTAKTRLPAAPDIPTVDEAGLPGLYISIWHALWLPKGTPKDIVDRLLNATRDALADPAVRKRLADLGQELPTPQQQNPETLRAHHKAEIDKWFPIIKAAGIKPEG